jgi:hypothetical protein
MLQRMQARQRYRLLYRQYRVRQLYEAGERDAVPADTLQEDTEFPALNAMLTVAEIALYARFYCLLCALQALLFLCVTADVVVLQLPPRCRARAARDARGARSAPWTCGQALATPTGRRSDSGCN